jgi:hypothetical protein
VVLSGFPDSTIGWDSYCCRRWNYLNGIYTLTRSGCVWEWIGYNGEPEDYCHWLQLRVGCEDSNWRMRIIPGDGTTGAWKIELCAPYLSSCPPEGVWTNCLCQALNLTQDECYGWNCAGTGSLGIATVSAV